MNSTTLSTLNCSGNTTRASMEHDNEAALKYAEFERQVRLIIPVVFGVVTLVGFVGNSLVITVIAANKHMRSTTNIFILSLALADLAFIMFCVPFTAVSYTHPTWPFGDVWCRIVEYLKYVCCYASVYTLVAMTCDRFLAVVYPMSSLAFRVQANAIRTVIIVWLVILLANIPLLVYAGKLNYTHYEEHRSVCLTILDGTNNTKLTVFHGVFFIFGYAIPFALMSMLYMMMIQRLARRTIPGETTNTSVLQTRKRVTRMVIIVVAVFALCWLPIQVILVWHRFGHYPITIPGVSVQFAANTLSYINSCLNPILYAFLSESFRKSFKDLLIRRSRYSPSSDAATRYT